MKKEDISKVLSDIDENYIEEAASVNKKQSTVIRYISIAACLAVAVIAGIALMNSESFLTVPPVDTENTTNESGGGDKSVQETVTTPALYWETESDVLSETGTEAEMMIMPQWADLKTSQKYGEVTVNGITYSTQNCETDEENILDFISDAEMSGYDIYEDKTYTVNTKVYSLKNIISECAVAVKFPDENKFYVYVNSWYVPGALGDLINAIDMKNTVSFGKAYKNYTDYDKGEHINIVFANFDDSIVWDMILDDTSVKNIEYDRFQDMLISISVDIPLLGYKDISLGVTKDGYIVTNILNTQKCFFIGKEKAEAFGEYISENVEYKEMVIIYENPDGTVPGKGEEVTGQSTPGYNPEEPVQIAPPYNPTTDSEPAAGNSEAITPIPEDFIVEETTKIK